MQKLDGKILVKISLSNNEKHIMTEVSDNGSGMQDPKEHLTCFATTKSESQYGSKTINVIKQTGKFGVGLSACLLYSILNTLKPMRIVSKIASETNSIIADFSFNFVKAEPEVIQKSEIIMSNANSQLSGTKISLYLQWIEDEREIIESIHSYVLYFKFA